MIKKIIQLTLCISVLTILYSCSSDPVCETCETVVYNDRAAQQGLANNGLEEVSRDYLGVFCDDALDQTRGLKESYQVGFGSIVYTEKVIVECQ